MWETWVQFNLCVGKIAWRWESLPNPVFWPGEFHRLYRAWDQKKSDLAEWLSLHFTYLLVGGSQPLGRCLPCSSTTVTGTSNKANFYFHQPGLFTGFWVISSETPHAYILVTNSTNKWKDVLCSSIGNVDIAKCLLYPKQYTDSM